jgi:hypothetical protein
MPNKWRAHIQRQSRQERAPSVAHRHAWKLPYEEHDPVVDAGRLFISKYQLPHALELGLGELRSQLVSVWKVVKDRLGLNRRDDGPDRADECTKPECVSDPDGILNLRPCYGCECCAAAEGCLRLYLLASTVVVMWIRCIVIL